MAKQLIFEGAEVSYVIGALTNMLEQVTLERDVEVLGGMLDRAVASMGSPPNAEIIAHIQAVRLSKGLPA